MVCSSKYHQYWQRCLKEKNMKLQERFSLFNAPVVARYLSSTWGEGIELALDPTVDLPTWRIITCLTVA